MSSDNANSQGSSEIVANNISKSFGAGPFAKEVVKDCSFSIESNKLTVMIGPSGCGKSSIIQLIAGFEQPTSGEITMNGNPITGPGKDRLVANFLLNKVGLEAFKDKYPAQLSGGMQRRAELARAMINKPEIMILDEPFRGLDHMSKELMWEYYAGLYEEDRNTNFFITTDIDEAIFADSDRANEIKTEVMTLLHEEAMKSFSGGSKAAADFLEAYSKRSG